MHTAIRYVYRDPPIVLIIVLRMLYYCISAMLQCFDITCMYVAMMVFIEIDFTIKADDDCMETKQENTGPCWLLSG